MQRCGQVKEPPEAGTCRKWPPSLGLEEHAEDVVFPVEAGGHCSRGGASWRQLWSQRAISASSAACGQGKEHPILCCLPLISSGCLPLARPNQASEEAGAAQLPRVGAELGSEWIWGKGVPQMKSDQHHSLLGHSFTHSFSKRLSGTFYELNTILTTRNILGEEKTQVPSLRGLMSYRTS